MKKTDAAARLPDPQQTDAKRTLHAHQRHAVHTLVMVIAVTFGT
jgi:hypothetical protein